MSFINDFPHTAEYDKDLGWLIKKYKDLHGDYQTLLEIYNYVKEHIKDITIEQLKKWLDDGTLEGIIQNLLLDFQTYTFLIDAINDTALKPGDRIICFNYKEIADNGGGCYTVSDAQQEYFSYKMKNNLYLNLLPANNMNVHQFGIFGDGETDITDTYQKAINFVCKYGDSYIYVPAGTYMVCGVDRNKTPSDTGHLLDNGGIKVLSGLTIEHDDSAIMQIIATNYQAYNLYRIYNVKNVKITGGILNGDRETHFGSYGGEWGYLIAISGSYNVEIENLTCQNAFGDGINLQYLFKETSLTQEEKTCTNIYIRNVESNMNKRQGMSLESGENVVIENSRFTNTNGTPPEFGLDIEPANSGSRVNNIHVRNCFFDGNHSRHIGMYAWEESNRISNVYIDNCYFGKSYNVDKYAISIEDYTDNIYLTNNIFDFVRPENSKIGYVILLNYNGNYTISNNIFKDGNITSIKDSNLIFTDNIIEEYQASSFFEVYKMGNWLIKNNTSNFAKNGLFIFTGVVTGKLIFTDNVLKVQGSQPQVIMIDNSPNANIIAVNNILTGDRPRITWSDIKKEQMISQGGLTGLNVVTNRPDGALVGAMAFEQNSGKPIFYTGTKWIFADGSDAV